MSTIPRRYSRRRRFSLGSFFEGLFISLVVVIVLLPFDLLGAWFFMLAMGIAHIESGWPPISPGYWPCFLVLVLLTSAFRMPNPGSD